MKASVIQIGIDEVGRGPIAGPVAVGACALLDPAARKFFRGVKDSKQLSEERREEWFARIIEAQRNGLVDFQVTFQSEKVIDNPRQGLAYAIRSALASSLGGLVEKHMLQPARTPVLLDGGLKAPAEFTLQKTIIRGDEKEMAIALASICAKVLRDRRMRVLARKHPEYGFETHKGYGTRSHYRAISVHGMLSVHRTSFLKKVRTHGAAAENGDAR